MNEVLYDILIYYNKKKEIDLLINKVNYNLKIYNKRWTIEDSKCKKKINKKLNIINSLSTYINMLKKKKEKITYDINVIKKRLESNINETDLELLYINQINLKKHINNNNILATSDVEDYIRKIIYDLISDLNINDIVNNISNEIDTINNSKLNKIVINNINTKVELINNIQDNVESEIILNKEVTVNKILDNIIDDIIINNKRLVSDEVSIINDILNNKEEEKKGKGKVNSRLYINNYEMYDENIDDYNNINDNNNEYYVINN